jgi:hypothetical protein
MNVLNALHSRILVLHFQFLDMDAMQLWKTKNAIHDDECDAMEAAINDSTLMNAKCD